MKGYKKTEKGVTNLKPMEKRFVVFPFREHGKAERITQNDLSRKRQQKRILEVC